MAWQRHWFELEILNGLALAEWDEQGQADDWEVPLRAAYHQDAHQLAFELVALIAGDDAYRPPAR